MKLIGGIFLVVGALLFLGVCGANARGVQSYQGNLEWYIADLKSSFEQSEFWSTKTALTEANYRAVLDGLKNNVGVNGIRLPIFPHEANPDHYPALYKNVFAYARSLGLTIYASPLSVGMKEYVGWPDRQYVQWLASYARYYHPDFISPFNESGLGVDKMATIVSLLRGQLGAMRPLIVGPDKQHVAATVATLEKVPAFAGLFDVLSSHNANKDTTATAENWRQLSRLLGGQKPVWASESPRGWETTDQIPGLAEAINGNVQGVVIWMAKPGLVDGEGRPTAKALDIAAHLIVKN